MGAAAPKGMVAMGPMGPSPMMGGSQPKIIIRAIKN